MKQGQFPAILPLASLNGKNGFKLDGEASGDQSGTSVSAAGDINGDGVSDLLIGADGHASGAGRSYVVFGGAEVGSSGLITLSGLNGSTGFKLDGEASSDYSGASVSAVGDINGDGVSDLLIGAYYHASATGRSYLVFGGAGVGSSSLIALSGLNGSDGFKLDGEASNDLSGFSVSAVGDINGDGVSDLLIGADGHASQMGRSYVVFGGPGVGSSGLIALSGLNGSTGFKLDGEASSDYSGYSVNTAGDINGDGVSDLLIGAIGHASQTGRSYVVFGGAGVGSSGLMALSGLNGSTGFKLDGEATVDRSGWSISAAGDINGDGMSDLLIGAPYHANYTGRNYVVFGGPGVGSSGLIPLSGLNGSNGFKLDGEAMYDFSGTSVSPAGDINGDGVFDLLIGAYNHANATGRSYVVFGGARVGSSGLIPLSGLDGSTGVKLDGEASNDWSGRSVSAAGDINGDGVSDLLIGADGHAGGAGCSYVVFGDIPPVLMNNSLSLSVGATISLNATFLAAYDRNHNNNTLMFVPSGVSHGQFEMIGASGVPLVNFTQQQVVSGAIQFVHDGTLVAPSYNITVRSTGIAWVGPLAAKINFVGTPPSYFPAVLPLSSLNGQNGFKLDGESTGDQSGSSVSAAGDINGDGVSDLLIGAPGHASNTGRSYVVFGGAGVSGSGLVALSGLNGSTGFKLDGEASGDESGYSVSAAGDINGDGVSDLLIGAIGYPSNYKGRSYVVFGGSVVGSNGTLALSSLNGSNGFKLDGESNGDFSGYSVSGIDDINDDGVSDLLIGAYGHASNTGRSYVVFGGPGVGGSGVVALSGLNGSNGFKLDGEVMNDLSGWSVSAAGDINHDGVADLVVGAYAHANSTGRSYVVFGGSGVGSSGVVALLGLNGSNGFKLDGEVTNDLSGYSVSAAGDINNDGVTDLVVGAYGHASLAGRSYVVFGSAGVGSNGVLTLSNLAGSNGFKLDGENSNDFSGRSVSMAGDINHDGVDDLLVGAYRRASQTGRSYVVFGGVGIGETGVLSLSSINGSNGFKLDGEASSDLSGLSVSTAGDINNDGVADMVVVAPYRANSTGRSYVIFGDVPPTLVQNRLSLTLGQTIRLNQTYLNAYDRNNDNNTLVFVPTAVSHGQFELVTQPGISLINFTQPQLQNNTIQFAHDGSAFAPSYNMTVYSAGIAWTGPYPANVSFLLSTPSPTPTPTPTSMPMLTPTPTSTPTPTATPGLPPILLLKNQLALKDGQTVVLSGNQLQAMEAGFNDSQLVFEVSEVQNGYFSSVPVGNSVKKNLTWFTQGQIQNNGVEFVHASNQQAPGYVVSVTDGVQTTPPSPAEIVFTDAPIIQQITLNITQGETITLTPTLLNVTATDGSTASQVVLTVSDLEHAVIKSNRTGAPVSNFTLTDLEQGEIQLTQDDSPVTPSLIITAEGVKQISSAPTPVSVYFSSQGVYAPRLVNNYLSVVQGQATVLSGRYLSAERPNGLLPDNGTVFYVSDISHGHFRLISEPQTWVAFFDQGQLNSGEVQFVQDGSLSIPSYDSAVQAFGLQSASLPAAVIFRPVNQPPRLVNSLTDQTATVGEPFTYAIPTDSFVDPEGESLTYQVSRYNSSALLPGWLHFEESSQRFIGTPTLKDFIDVNVTAQDPEGLSTTTDFTINVISASAESGFTTWEKTILGALISGGIGIGFAFAQICLKRMANKKLLQVLGEGDSKYDQDVVRPVAKEIAQRLKITRFMNATTNKELMAFKSAVRSLLSALSDKGVNLNFAQMKDAERDKTINEIGNQTYRWMKANQRGCAARCPGLHAFFKPQLQPEELQGAAEEIADQVVSALRGVKKSRTEIRLSAGLSVSGSPVFKELEDKQSMELREIDSPSKKGAEPEEFSEPAVLN